MKDRRPVSSQEGVPVVFELDSQSPHAFAYKVWYRRPGAEDWETCDCCEGDTAEDPDPCTVGALPDRTELDIPVAIGGQKESAYRGLVKLTQDGRPMPGGTIELSGRTSGDGGGAEYLRLVLE